jgi:TRAP-type uncharacterized transport system substrate-binding protein
VAENGPVYFPDSDSGQHLSRPARRQQQLSVANILAVREDMPAELVTTILRITWDNREDWARVHAEARNFTLPAQKTAAAGIPWHPAAEAFWRTAGASLA